MNFGKTATRKIIAQIVIRYGRERRATSSSFTSVIFMVIKRFDPNGGVRNPVSQQTTKRIPS